LGSRVEQQIKAMREQASLQTYTAQDDWALIEVTVNGVGLVTEVAVNADLLRQAQPIDLAEAILQAAQKAQQFGDKDRTAHAGNLADRPDTGRPGSCVRRGCRPGARPRPGRQCRG
jgi:hypothetical protein